jgi:hypothetical protein
VLVVYAIGVTQYTKLLLEYIFDVTTSIMAYDAYNVITLPMMALSNHMMNGQTNAKHTALGEAVHRKNVDVYLRGTYDIDIAVGRSQEDLEASVKQFVIAALSDSTLCIVVKIHGFKPKRIKCDVSDSNNSNSDRSESEESVKFTGKYNAAQFIRTCAVIPILAVKNKIFVKQEKYEADEADEGKGEVFSMEDRLKSKDFQMITSINLASREETPEWYGILVAHGEMCGVFIPPSDSIMPYSIMGQYWSKHILGEMIHGRRRMMESHVHTFLLTDGLFAKYCEKEYRDIVKASGGNGYAALRNMVR